MWYYTQNGEKHGPISKEEMITLVRYGDLRDEDQLWKEGMRDWIPVSVARDKLPPSLQEKPAGPPPLPDQGPPQTFSALMANGKELFAIYLRKHFYSPL